MEKQIKIEKQSLVDYEVTTNGKHVAWITKTGKEWKVDVKGVGTISFSKFADAKEYAKVQARI